jgi:hypothetical protein
VTFYSHKIRKQKKLELFCPNSLTFVDIFSTEKVPKFFFLENKKKLTSQILRYFFGNQTANFNYGHKAWLFEQNIFSLFENGQKKCPISNFPKNFPKKI